MSDDLVKRLVTEWYHESGSLGRIDMLVLGNKLAAALEAKDREIDTLTSARSMFKQNADMCMEHLRQERARCERMREALDSIVKAWESLPGGQRYRARDVERWLIGQMKQAIDEARAALQETENDQ